MGRPKGINWQWLRDRMAKFGLSYRSLGVSHGTLKGWDAGKEAKPATLRKLAKTLEVEVSVLVKRLRVRPMSTAKRQAIGKRLTADRLAKAQ